MNEEMVKQKCQELGISIDGTRRVLESAFKESVRLVKELDVHCSGDNHSKVQEVSHRLKGVFANLQFAELSQSAQQINTAAAQKENILQIIPQVKKLKEQYEQLRKEFGV